MVHTINKPKQIAYTNKTHPDWDSRIPVGLISVVSVHSSQYSPYSVQATRHRLRTMADTETRRSGCADGTTRTRPDARARAETHHAPMHHHNRVRDRTLLMRVMRVLSAPLSTHGRACHLRWAMRGKSGWLLDCEHQAAWLRGMSDGWDKHTLMHHSRRSGMSNESSSRGRRAALSLW